LPLYGGKRVPAAFWNPTDVEADAATAAPQGLPRFPEIWGSHITRLKNNELLLF
jgi:hypothetical protein